jgi:hypothetical protein
MRDVQVDAASVRCGAQCLHRVRSERRQARLRFFKPNLVENGIGLVQGLQNPIESPEAMRRVEYFGFLEQFARLQTTDP